MWSQIQPIAYIRTDFKEKFGIPRQGRAVPSLQGRIEFLPSFCDANALRGLEEFSHLWLIWQFSESVAKMERDGWSPTVRPPRLGGNVRRGVFATRSSFRPNSLALTAVKIEGVLEQAAYWGYPEKANTLSVEEPHGKEKNRKEQEALALTQQEREANSQKKGKGLQENPPKTAAQGPVILVSGVDLMDGTPIFDIKPYIPFADSIPDAVGGFADGPWKAENKKGEREASVPTLLAQTTTPQDSLHQDPAFTPLQQRASVAARGEDAMPQEKGETQDPQYQMYHRQLRVQVAPELLGKLPEEKRPVLVDVLAADPRPAYQQDPQRMYGMSFAGYTVRFTVEGHTLNVVEIL